MDATKKSLEYSVNDGRNTRIDTWIGVRKSGNFSSCSEDTVDVKIENNKVGSKVWMRGYSKGFWVTMNTTTCYNGLYADWYDPLNDDTLQKVLYYFNVTVINGLKDNHDVLTDLENIIGKKTDGVSFS